MEVSIPLRKSEVHIWRAPLDLPDVSLAQARELLSEDECGRADRFHFARDRRRFIAARSWMRKVLGSYTRRDPASLSFRLSKFGKPCLEGHSAPFFNVSHSHELAVCAVAWQPVGVDIEHIRPIAEALNIARHFFSPSEILELRKYPTHEVEEAFLRCWTRKEAFIKAKGLGISMALDSFSVSLDRKQACLLDCTSESEEISRWRMMHLTVAAQYTGALVVKQALRADVRLIEMN